MSKYMRVDGVMVKKALKSKGLKLVDVSAELGKSHSYLSNCLSQGYLDDKELRFLCAKYGISYYEVRRGWAYGNVTKYDNKNNKKPVEVEEKAPEVVPDMSTDAKIDLILRNLVELNTMMSELIRRDNK